MIQNHMSSQGMSREGAAVPARLLASLPAHELEALRYDWPLWARPAQMPPAEDFRVWLILAGRGWGKTRTGAEYVRHLVEQGKTRRLALVGETWADVRDVMIEGESGILNISPPWARPLFEPSKRRLTWDNGTLAFAYSASDPDQLRGPQFDTAWADEVAKWEHRAAWDNLMLCLRLGKNPTCVATTTPRPITWLRALATARDTFLTRGTTYDNAANLAPAFLQEIVSQYEGTRLGRQELEAHFLTEVEGALWRRDHLERFTVPASQVPPLDRIVVAIDPATTHGDQSGETGIIVAGVKRGDIDYAYILADLSLKAAPQKWARVAVNAYHHYRADRIIAEVNQGGDLVESMLRVIDPDVPYLKVHATRGKTIRAEPVAALYEQGKVFHVQGLSLLEDQLCTFNGSGPSPDRMDALVWALTHLMLSSQRYLGTAKLTGF